MGTTGYMGIKQVPWAQSRSHGHRADHKGIKQVTWAKSRSHEHNPPLVPSAQAFAIGQGIAQIALLGQLHDQPSVQALEAHAVEVHNVLVVAAA